MKRRVITHNEIEGFHAWENAPEICSFLRNEHRHVFVIRCWFEVSGNDREIEIITKQWDIYHFLHSLFGKPCKFKGMSCEDIADMLLKEFTDMNECQVLEDGYGGASLTR